jgi:hypothetical protein
LADAGSFGHAGLGQRLGFTELTQGLFFSDQDAGASGDLFAPSVELTSDGEG